MDSPEQLVQFISEVGDDQVIRPPSGVSLPHGQVEVVVKPVSSGEESPFQWLMDLIEEAEAEDPDLPPDLALNHDHYAHGAPKSYCYTRSEVRK